MYPSFRRATPVASTLKTCTVCGSHLPMPVDFARAAESMCGACARPIRLGAIRVNVAHRASESVTRR